MRNCIFINKRVSLVGILSILIFSSCNEQWDERNSFNVRGPEFLLNGNIKQQNESRANSTGFVDGDRMGIFIVDYVNGTSDTLSATANRASNVLYTFNESENSWNSATTLYWKDNVTPVDVYGYYPGVNYIETPSKYRLEVSHQQNIIPDEGEMSNYEASDFLWGKVTKVSPTTQTITVTYNHRMAGVQVNLKMGSGFVQQEWEKLKKQIQVDNTIRTATINIANGIPVADGVVDKSIQMLAQSGDVFRAVVVPQTVTSGKSLMTLTIDGYTYTHQLTSEMNYMMGKLHNFTLTVNKATDGGSGYTLQLECQEITDWTNDESSHNFTSNKYVVIDCPAPGTLKSCINNAGYDYEEMKNLKVTGALTGSDFEFMKNEMKALAHLNLKEIQIKDVVLCHRWVGSEYLPIYTDNALPENAFCQNKTIRSIVLPKSITRIGENAFREMKLMYSTVEVPEGVTYIGGGAFCYNENNGVELVLPFSLDSIEGRAFAHCHFSCELKLNDKIKYIGGSAFENTSKFHGNFYVPSNLAAINEGAFYNLGSEGSFSGSIEIPQGITEIQADAFRDVALANRTGLTIPQGVKRIGGAAFVRIRLHSLHFNDDLEEIGEGAFLYTSLPFQLNLPSNLKVIGHRAFMNAGIQGELVIPESCLNISSEAFPDNQITKITLPSRLEMIPEGCFGSLPYLREVTIPKYVDYIGKNAFNGDGSLQTIICMNPEPPTLGTNAFGEVNMNKVILQVPESSVGRYRNATGWNQFKNITAYHELAFNIPEMIAMDKGMSRKGILSSEGDWEVAECPSWVKVSPTSGSTKAEITITVDGQTQGAGNREGNIVFRLKDKNYTTSCIVKQITSTDVAEDQTVVLQTASAGAPRAVPLFIVGNGYNAEEIVSGKYLNDMKEQMEHFFSIEPFKTYRKYFTVSTAYACSPESGADDETKFGSEEYDGAYGNAEMVWKYALDHGKGISVDREADCTIMVLVNTSSTNNSTDIASNGRTVSWIGKSSDSYPFDQKSQVLREVGGVAFGKLGPEGVSHFTFMKACTCPGCNMQHVYNEMSGKGWYRNVATSAKMNDLPWYHYIFHSKYSSYVDVYEGALRHARGTYRSENVSIMGNTYVPYFNTISREAIVRRIMECAGATFSLENFINNDIINIPE